MPTDDKLDAYHHTLLHFPGPPALVVDLREPVGASTAESLRALGLDGPFAVLTAENPEGEHSEDEDSPDEAARAERANARRTRTLAAALDAAGLRWVPVTGTAPDGAYPERCAAVRIGRAAAVQLALAERQLALFWWDGTAFWLLPAAADGAPERLPTGGVAATPR